MPKGEPDLPPLYNGRMTVYELLRYAQTFDEISSHQRYAAVDFIEWLIADVRYEGKRRYCSPSGRPGQLRREPAGRPGRLKASLSAA